MNEPARRIRERAQAVGDEGAWPAVGLLVADPGLEQVAEDVQRVGGGLRRRGSGRTAR